MRRIVARSLPPTRPGRERAFGGVCYQPSAGDGAGRVEPELGVLELARKSVELVCDLRDPRVEG
jgi:hypothetical protein